MADVDWDELEIQVAKIRRSTPLLEATPEAIEALLDRDAANPPLLFDEVQTSVFGAWLLTLEKPDGSSLSYSALNTHRAGLFNLYRDYGRELSPAMENEMREYSPQGAETKVGSIFWDTSSFDGNDWLFPGSNQCERFRKCLHRLLESEDVAEALTRRCVNRDDLEAHSTRKGSTTYCGSGSTACPSSKFVHLRAGRPLGGVQSTYLLYASTGDIHVGRTMSGLTSGSHEFAALPPH
ncbi:hypothetical protein GQ600_27271 [Phytophthora cactorum]|nr:hypothetical protein GQ600_27271 [Phytophthora cactorum]